MSDTTALTQSTFDVTYDAEDDAIDLVFQNCVTNVETAERIEHAAVYFNNVSEAEVFADLLHAVISEAEAHG